MGTVETTATPIVVQLPERIDPRWSRLPGVRVDGRIVTVDPAEYFFRFDSNTWRVVDWDLVHDRLLGVRETSEKALEQIALEFIQEHGRSTDDPAEVLSTAWHVYSYLFREELLPVAGLEQIGPQELRMLREAAVFMALNKVEQDGSISNVGPCWFLPAATGVVFDLDDEDGQALDEVYHGTWFNESAGSSPSWRTQRSAVGWCTAASPRRTRPAAHWCPTAGPSSVSARTWHRSGTGGSLKSRRCAPADPPRRENR
jgi:hypothetical protein